MNLDKCKCKFCSSKLNRADNLKKHLKLMHSSIVSNYASNSKKIINEALKDVYLFVLNKKTINDSYLDKDKGILMYFGHDPKVNQPFKGSFKNVNLNTKVNLHTQNLNIKKPTSIKKEIYS